MIHHDIYTTYTGDLIAELYSEVLVLGILFVGVNYFKGMLGATQKHRPKGDFIRRIVLFFSVTMIVSYYAVSYIIETKGGPEEPAVEQCTKNESQRADEKKPNEKFSGGHGFLPVENSILILVLVDLFLIGVSGMLFVVLSLDFMQKDKSENKVHTLKDELFAIFLLSAIWHYGAVVWWFNWFGSTGIPSEENLTKLQEFFGSCIFCILNDSGACACNSAVKKLRKDFSDEFNSVLFHTGVATSHLVFGVVMRLLLRDTRLNSHQSKLEWLGVGMFTFIVSFIYVERFGGLYIQKMLRYGNKPCCHSTTELITVPLVTLAMVNSLLTWRLWVHRHDLRSFVRALLVLWAIPVLGHVRTCRLDESRNNEEPSAAK